MHTHTQWRARRFQNKEHLKDTCKNLNKETVVLQNIHVTNEL
jgi:hypothetical protein